MATWVSLSDTSGLVCLNPAYVEAVIAERMTSPGQWHARIIMASGLQYVAWFPSVEERDEFVSGWATDPTYLDIEPIDPATY